jgi:uncharacterized membrane protein
MAIRQAGLLLLLALVLAGCGRERPAAAPVNPPPAAQEPAASRAAAPPDLMLRGIVRLNPTLTFRACDGQLLATVLDSTGERLIPAYQVLRPGEEGIYVEAAGRETENREVVLRSLEYAARPGPGLGCEQPASAALLRAFGRRPLWRLSITATGVELTQAGQPALTFAPPALDDSAGHLRYRADRFHLLLTALPCTEDSTGTFGSMQAVVTAEGKVLRGCASRGVVR